MTEEQECWLCTNKDIIYTDILGMAWCQDDYDKYYWVAPDDPDTD